MPVLVRASADPQLQWSAAWVMVAYRIGRAFAFKLRADFTVPQHRHRLFR
jgi:hypothetical protein